MILGVFFVLLATGLGALAVLNARNGETGIAAFQLVVAAGDVAYGTLHLAGVVS